MYVASTSELKYFWQDLARSEEEKWESGGVSVENLENPEIEAFLELLEVQRRGGDEDDVAASRTHDHYPLITGSGNRNANREGEHYVRTSQDGSKTTRWVNGQVPRDQFERQSVGGCV